MKKLTAVISAAAIAATMAVPLTAGAADSLGTKYYTLSEKVGSATKYTMTFDIITNDTDCDSFYVKFNESTYEYVNVLDVYSNKNDNYTTARIRTNGYRLGSDSSAVNPTDASSTINGEASTVPFFTIGQTYKITLEVDGKNVTVDVDGRFANMNMDFVKTTVTIPDSIDPTQIIISNYTTADSQNGLQIDNVTFTVQTEEDTPAAAETKKVDAVINGESVQIGGTTFTEVSDGSVVFGDKYITFYKTTVTAGTKAVSGVTIKPEDYTGDAAEIEVNAEANGGTASFYSAVITGSTEVTDWKHSFTYVD